MFFQWIFQLQSEAPELKVSLYKLNFGKMFSNIDNKILICNKKTQQNKSFRTVIF